MLSDACSRFNWVLHAYCLMTNHYHLLIETPDGNLSLGMRHLNGVYTQRFNRGHKRVGRVFQGRYKAILEVDWILSAFGRNKGRAQKAYREYVSEGRNQPAPWEHLINQIYMGSEEFMVKAQDMLEQDKDLSEIPAPQKRSVPKSMTEYENQV